MTTQMKAFFYEYKYYAFPDGVKSLDELKKMPSVTCMRLKEERCMAPDFIFESTEEETLAIEHPERLFEVSVTIRTGEEYDEILRKQVDKVCHDCERYIPDGDPRDTGNLDGHHREISLDGVCYEREGKNDPWDFGTCAKVFWYRISTKLNELAKYIDAGNQKKLNAVLNRELQNFMFPANFYGGVHEGKYCLTFMPDFDHVPFVRLLYRYLTEVAMQDNSEIKEAGWEVFPCRKQGVFRYTGKHKFRKELARIVPAENPNGVGLELYCKKADDKKRYALFQDLFAYLAEQIGEAKAYTLVTEVTISADKTDKVPVSELIPALEKKYREAYGDEEQYPAPLGYGSHGGEHDFPFREKITEGATVCPDISFLTLETLHEAWWMDFCGFAYLYVPHSPADALETVSWYLANGNLVPEPLRDPEEGGLTGGSAGVGFCGEDGFILDCFVASEKAFFRRLRIIAPVLQSYGVKLVTVKKEGVTVYDCGYQFTISE
ncbi:MAG: hypothetical protein K2G44_02775 [Clostridia bacterium]|nr:hypothetical protein [Clostridia bacterium]